jgi:hypothetical protein
LAAFKISQVFKKGTQAFQEGMPAFANNFANPKAGNSTISKDINIITNRSCKLIMGLFNKKSGQKYHINSHRNRAITNILLKKGFISLAAWP